MTTTVRDFLAEHRDAVVAELAEWIRIPSVAGVPEHLVDLQRSANWLAAALRETGFPSVEVWDTEDGPAVYAEWCAAPDAPTVLIYSHHDVRAAKDEEWDETAPFDPKVRDGYLYGRGASDAKGQALAHVWGVRAHLAATGRADPAVNIKVLVEGEEETGSAHLRQLLEDNRERVGADLIVFSDTLLWRADHPAVCVSMRGTMLAKLEILGPLQDVHSGAVSGPAPNPVLEMSRLLAQLHDDKGRIAVPGFYDSVVEPSQRFRDELAALPYSDADWLERSRTRSVGGEAGYTVLERLWTRPAIEVTSMISGDPIGPSRAAVPSLATADLSIRYVCDQTGAEIAEQLRQWVAGTVSERFDHRLTVSPETAQDPYRTPDDLPAVAVLAEAMQEGFGRAAGRMGNAGGGPAVWLTERVGAPVVYFGTGLPEDHWHDSNERVSIDVLLAGAATLAAFWDRLPSA
ncbi:M20/M25/M40 family metallo-hydrolase [Paractinoplanes abujensis]|uniref:Acetylornithine deacetylase/succinyl-diaminopimelate desuccinylase-like protein n=1 Tax=Paractinoplanes abujensis TaxID=882441 RepID=A0A7W7FZC1_9ACTN|nr:M20/M25/M40 family metallo-hydrolase [Actinoplanes abujensis]MBB4689935.1 acetylornithine deacetylase/succinyl-diaminopimelate desuccinylase-like protein [Actinoplanes abujensis]